MFHFRSVSNLRQRFHARRRKRDEEEFVANANELHLLAGRQGCAAEQFNGFLGQGGSAGRRETTRTPNDDKEHAKDSCEAAADGNKRAVSRRRGRTIQGNAAVLAARGKTQWPLRSGSR